MADQRPLPAAARTLLAEAVSAAALRVGLTLRARADSRLRDGPLYAASEATAQVAKVRLAGKLAAV